MRKKVKSEICLSVVIVLYKSTRFIHSLLSSLLMQKVDWSRLELIFVAYHYHNVDRDIREIKKKLHGKHVKILYYELNKGFGWGCNRGVEQAKGEKILFLNPDIALEDTSIFRKICNVEVKNSIIGALTYSLEDKKVRLLSFRRKPNIGVYLFEFTNLKKIWTNNPYSRRFNFLDFSMENDKKCINVDSVSGSFLLIKKKDFVQLGMFDERFFLYLEDLDLCLRYKNQDGHVLMCPFIKVFHYGGGSSKNRERVCINAWIKSRDIFVKKHIHNYFLYLLVRFVFSVDSLLIKLKMKLFLK